MIDKEGYINLGFSVLSEDEDYTQFCKIDEDGGVEFVYCDYYQDEFQKSYLTKDEIINLYKLLNE